MEKKKLNLKNAHAQMWDVCYNCMYNCNGTPAPLAYQVAMIAAGVL